MKQYMFIYQAKAFRIFAIIKAIKIIILIALMMENIRKVFV